MAVNNSAKRISFPAGQDLSDYQFRIVGMSGDGQIDPVAAGTVPSVVGILMNKPAAGAGAEVAINGIAKLEAGATLNEGEYVQAAAGGRGIPLDAGGTAYVVGVCVQAASGSGAIAGVLIQPQKVVAA